MTVAIAPMRRIGIRIRPDSVWVQEQTLQLIHWLASHACHIYCEPDTTEQLSTPTPAITTLPFEQWVQQIEVVVVVGGDGTMLRACRELASYHLPIVGVHGGRLGFLTDFSAHEPESLLLALQGHCSIEQRSLLFARVFVNTEPEQLVFESVALNDVVLAREVSGMLEMQLSTPSQLLTFLRGDGVIFSTPTGSTAYSMAAGGPVIHPDARVFGVVPINPHTLTHRPLVIPDSEVLRCCLCQSHGATLRLDGAEGMAFGAEHILEIGLSQQHVSLVHPLPHAYYAKLREKLSWGEYQTSPQLQSGASHL